MIIFIQSSFPAVELPKVELFSFDKVVHAGVFGLLAAFGYLSFINLNPESTFSSSPYLWSAIVCILYGASDEFHQYFVPNRSSEVLDWVADIVGVLIMLLIIKYFLSKRFKMFQVSALNKYSG